VTFGDTFRVPDVDTSPISGSISTLSAFVDDQLKVVLWPQSIESGATDSITVGGGA